MKPRKAVEILTEHVKISKLDYLPDVRDATKLGTEALRAITIWRISHDDAILMTLVGETED